MCFDALVAVFFAVSTIKVITNLSMSVVQKQLWPGCGEFPDFLQLPVPPRSFPPCWALICWLAVIEVRPHRSCLCPFRHGRLLLYFMHSSCTTELIRAGAQSVVRSARPTDFLKIWQEAKKKRKESAPRGVHPLCLTSTLSHYPSLHCTAPPSLPYFYFFSPARPFVPSPSNFHLPLPATCSCAMSQKLTPHKCRMYETAEMRLTAMGRMTAQTHGNIQHFVSCSCVGSTDLRGGSFDLLIF